MLYAQINKSFTEKKPKINSHFSSFKVFMIIKFYRIKIIK